MPDIAFDSSGQTRFPTKHHGEVTLSKQKWEKICSEQERWYYRFNGEKIGTTLVNPDYVRHHKHISTQFLYYKAFQILNLSESSSVQAARNFPSYFAVIIDTATMRVCTVYPVLKPKPGKEYKG
jgi:hypothetical protein